MNYDGKTLRDQRICIDGNSFVGAHLICCQLVYEGGAIPNLTLCTFEQCIWHFEDNAARALTFLAYLEAGNPETFKGLLNMARKKLKANFSTLSKN